MKMNCGCEVLRSGEKPNADKCTEPSHKTGAYDTTEYACGNYRPDRVPLSGKVWPRCVCGEIAQEH